MFGVEFPNKFTHSERNRKVSVFDPRDVMQGTEASRQPFWLICQHLHQMLILIQRLVWSLCPDEAHRVLDQYGLFEVFKKGVICVSTCETGLIARNCFADVSDPSARLDAHRVP